MSSPLTPAIIKLASGQSVTIQIIGDSTSWGVGDTGVGTYDANNVLGPPPLRGWPGRLAVLLGQKYNATVNVWTWNYNANTAYENFTTLYTGTGTGTITVYQGGWPGGVITNYLANLPEMLPVSNPDIVMIYDGYNEISYGVASSTYASNMVTLVGDIQTTYCPGAPIVVCTQHGTPTAPYDPSYYDVMVQRFLPAGAIFLSPALQQSTVNTGVWVLDTQQVPLVSTDIAFGVHPDASGYTKIANWIFGELDTVVVITESPASAVVGVSGSVPEVIAPFYPSPALVVIESGVFNGSKLPWTLPFALARYPLGGSNLPWTLPLVLGRLFPISPVPAVFSISGGIPGISGITQFIYPAGAPMAINGERVVLWEIAFVPPENTVTVRPEGKTSQVAFEPRTTQIPLEDRRVLVLGVIPVRGA